jgi:hypothetical protein
MEFILCPERGHEGRTPEVLQKDAVQVFTLTIMQCCLVSVHIHVVTHLYFI